MIRITTLGLLLALFALIRPAAAQPCIARDDLLRALSERYGEVLAMQGMVPDGRLVEIFIAPSGSWTIALTRPEGVSCPILAGVDAAVILPRKGDPA